MPSRSIRWSWISRIPLMLITSSFAFSAMGETDQGEVTKMLQPDQLTLRTPERVLQPGLAVTPQEADYGITQYANRPLPKPYLVPLDPASPDKTVVIEAEAPSVAKEYDTWVIYQDNPIDSGAESRIYAKITDEYAKNRCLTGYDCPGERMDLPEWPTEDEGASSEASLEIFKVDMGSPINPIPELNDLPFPKQ